MDTKNMHTAVAQAMEVQRWMRRYRWWRCLALVGILLGLSYGLAQWRSPTPKVDYIVKLHLKDEISDMEQVRRAHVLLEDPHLKGVLVIANSPGGLPAVSEAWGKFFERLQRKNVVVVAIAEDVCASGCYLAIMGMKKIFAYNSSIIGSVGAVMAYPNIYHILKKIDVDYTVIKSGILKAEPQPYSAPRPEYAEEMQKMVNAIGVWFVDKVSSSRGLHNKDSIRQIIAKGGVFTAQEAQKLFLIDAIGDEIDALEYLRDTLQSPNIPCSVFAVDDNAWIQQMLRKYGVTAQFKAYLQPYLL